MQINWKGLDELTRKLNSLNGQMDGALQTIAMGVGQEVKNEAGKYPSKKPGVASAAFEFVSDKQRRWFFWALNTGQIDVPYIRKKSAGLAGAWSVKRHGQTGAVVGNPKSYAPYVHGDDSQTSMMAAIGWPTTSDLVDRVEKSGAAVKVANRVIDRLLSRLGLK